MYLHGGLGQKVEELLLHIIRLKFVGSCGGKGVNQTGPVLSLALQLRYRIKV